MNGDSAKNILFDTSAIRELTDHRKKERVVKEWVEKARQKKIEAMMSAISVYELVFLIGLKDYKRAISTVEFLKNANVKIVPAEEKNCFDAASLKIKYRDTNLSTADMIIIATGIDKNATVITTDKEFQKIQEVHVDVV